MLPYSVWWIVLLACLLNGDARKIVESDVSETKVFSASLECSPRYKTTDKIECQFHLKNDGKEDYSVLKWRTPLQGMTSNCLNVTRNGDKIPYDGIAIKRNNPGPEEFVLVAAGQTVSSKFTISEGYDMTLAGTYSVKVDTYIEYAVGSVKGMNEPGKPAIHVKLSHLSSPAVTFQISVGGQAGAGTSGQRARSIEREEKRTLLFRDPQKRGTPRDPAVQGSNAQRAETIEVNRAAYNEIVSAISDCNNRVGRITTWFGNTPYLAYITETYQLIEQALRSETITYIFGGWHCDSSTYAYTWKGTRTIYLCGLYEDSPKYPNDWHYLDSKMGTLIHELAHAIGYSDDHAYGTYACKQLAKSNVAHAADNADNYAYFITQK